jgi:hypothetical protein
MKIKYYMLVLGRLKSLWNGFMGSDNMDTFIMRLESGI